MRKNGANANQIVVVDGKPRIATQIDRAAAMELAEMYVVRKLPKYLKKLHELAMGITVQRESASGPKTYIEPPSFQALTYLADRGLGRIPQRHEITGQDGGPMEILPWRPRGFIEGEVIDATIVQEVPQPASEPVLAEQGEDKKRKSGKTRSEARG